MRESLTQRVLAAVVGWGVALLLFFPIAWMVLTSFKTEGDAITPRLMFSPTLASYAEVLSRADYLSFAWNSILVSVGGTVLALLLAVPAAYSMAFHPTQRTRGTLLWMLSTKMLPPVGVLVPIYILADRGLDAVHLLQGSAEGHPGSGPDGRRADGERGLVSSAPVDAAGHRFHGAAVADPMLE